MESGELRKLFEEKLAGWEKEKGEKANKELQGKLMYWGTYIKSDYPGTLWAVIEDQIRWQAVKKGVTPEEFIGALFTQETADRFMFFMQL